MITGINEFIVKVATVNINEINATVITLATFGVIQLHYLWSKKTRNAFVKQKGTVALTTSTEVVGYSALMTLHIAMSGVAATIVSAIAVSQALFVLVFEQIANRFIGITIRDKQ